MRIKEIIRRFKIYRINSEYRNLNIDMDMGCYSLDEYLSIKRELDIKMDKIKGIDELSNII